MVGKSLSNWCGACGEAHERAILTSTFVRLHTPSVDLTFTLHSALSADSPLHHAWAQDHECRKLARHTLNSALRRRIDGANLFRRFAVPGKWGCQAHRGVERVGHHR